ncbi:PREDICTED: uncharacterized protein LOC106814072 isoform X2 [Priapulus caudatus]|uniref:Uncharacterized protein LOC106814072 isoform X2 n=1 Tax=Priapulus caudatus TaxID=37621 RepID=A0ABM1ENQ9_PRICU|nr:PREDICTED: uncharacterized protein LOC106814072 isoform X2 [Priapulus caudatus]
MQDFTRNSAQYRRHTTTAGHRKLETIGTITPLEEITTVDDKMQPPAAKKPRRYTDEEFKIVKAEWNAKLKAKREYPLFVLVPVAQWEPHIQGDYHLHSSTGAALENLKVAALPVSCVEPVERPSKVEHALPIFSVDIQSMLMYALMGDHASFTPRWFKLAKWNRVSHIVVTVVEDFSKAMYTQHMDSLPRVNALFKQQVELVAPSLYGGNFLDELLTVPLSMSVRRRFERASRGTSTKQTAEGVYAAMMTVKLPELPSGDTAQACDEGDTEQPAKDAVVNEAPDAPVNVNDNFDRTWLIMNPEELASDKYPLPLSGDPQCARYVYSKDYYEPVTSSSPMFCIDCEMCMVISKKYVLTRIAVVDEQLQCVYETLVMPHLRIIDYVTKYSGITKELLQGVTTSLQDVQTQLKNILPADAILVGHSLSNDLHAMEMFHPYIIDTSIVYNTKWRRCMKTSLRQLTSMFLGREIQCWGAQGHHPTEDAIATMELLLLKLRHDPSFGNVLEGFHLYSFSPPKLSTDASAPINPFTSPSVQSLNKAQQGTRACRACGGRVGTDGKLLAAPSADAATQCDEQTIADATAGGGGGGCTECEEMAAGDSLTEGLRRQMFQQNAFFFKSGRTAHLYELLDSTDISVAVYGNETCKMLCRAPPGHGRYTCCTDDKHVRETACEQLPNNKLSIVHLSGVGQATGNKLKCSIERLDKRIAKLTKACADKALHIVVLAGSRDPNNMKTTNGLCLIKVKKPAHL